MKTKSLHSCQKNGEVKYLLLLANTLMKTLDLLVCSIGEGGG